MSAQKTPALQPPRWFCVALVILGALAIGIATLVPAPEPVDPLILPPFSCLVCGDLGSTDIVLNLLLFAPFGAGLALLGLRPRRVFLIAAMVSLTIEALQVKVISGRDASVSDLVTNSLGALLVAWLVHRRVMLVLPDRRRATRLAIAALTAWISLEAAAAWALQPALPETVYWGQWAPNLGFLDQFKGTVLGAAVAGDSLPPRRLAESERLRQQLLRGAGPVTARATTGEAPDDLAPIVSVFDGRFTEIFLLGQRRDEAFFRLRTRVSVLKLRPPAIRIRNAVPRTPGESISLAASYTGGRYSLHVEADGRTLERTLDASPNLAWSFFMPFGNYALGDEARWLTALWVGGLLFPIGYWAGRSGSSFTTLAAVTGVGLTLALVPRAFELPHTHLSEWGAAALGLLLGYAPGHWSIRSPDSTELDGHSGEAPPGPRSASAIQTVSSQDTW